jgi:hypothetical protein|tara:strand:- start:984 stop:1622 length:639 start_codon:yes stop_codon:yes gene_type:complete
MPLNRNIPPIGDRTIDDFKSRLVQGGARPNLFEVEFNFPTAIGDQLSVSTVEEDLKFRMMIKGAQLPASNIAEVVVPFRGRQLKVAGDRRFDPWTITIMNDGDFNIRDAFEKWSNFIVKVSDGSGTINPADYQANWTVHQLGRGAGDLLTPGELNANQLPVLRSYRMNGCWPSAVSGIELSYDSADTIEEFQVTLQVQYWEAFDKDAQDAIV